MSELLKLCEKYFQTKDFYEILNIERTASDKDVKKAYHKLSLLVHPDRVEEDKKVEATEKFKVLGKIHSILSDSNKRAIYDESGEFDEESDSGFNWIDYWRSLFKKITIEDIQNYEKDYKGSEIELRDIKRSYLDGKGSMDYMYDHVPFLNFDNEERIIGIVKGMIEKEEVPEYKNFTNEPKSKKERRRRKWEREQTEAESVNHEELAKALEENQKAREKRMQDFFSDLEAKYGEKPKKKRPSIANGNEPSPKRTRSQRKKK